MINPPMTREEAEKTTYGSHWDKRRYESMRCVQEVYDSTGFGCFYQCSRRPGHGPDDLYCKQHAKIVEGDAT